MSRRISHILITMGEFNLLKNKLEQCFKLWQSQGQKIKEEQIEQAWLEVTSNIIRGRNQELGEKFSQLTPEEKKRITHGSILDFQLFFDEIARKIERETIAANN